MTQRKIPPPEMQAIDIITRVAAAIKANSLINRNDRVLVAVSGGSDSLALLYLLRALDLPIHLMAAYIDHGLRPREIPRELNLLRSCCHALNIPFLTRSVDVHRLLAAEKRSPEEAARILRYQALEELRRENGAEVIATGHTADDQVEEFFLRLIRGSSRRALSGMTFRRDRIIRPLLHETKADLMRYLAASHVEWCLDSSNLERHFLRNRVRLELLPLLEKEFNPAIRRVILQNMDILAEEEDFLENTTTEAATRCIETGETAQELVVAAEPFLAEHPAVRRRILETCFVRMGIKPAYGQIDRIVELMATGGSRAEIHLDDGVRAERLADHLRFCRPLGEGRKRGSRPALPAIELTISGPGRYPVSAYRRELILKEMDIPAMQTDTASLVIDRAKVEFPLTLRSARPGETFHPFNSPGRKKISRFFNARKIPAHERASWPALLAGDMVVALPGLQIDHAFRTTEATTSVLRIDWRKTREY